MSLAHSIAKKAGTFRRSWAWWSIWPHTYISLKALHPAFCRYFLEELRVLEHLEALRRAFFMGAGDWADAFAGALAAHADSLEPLGQHALERLLAGSLRVCARLRALACGGKEWDCLGGC